MPGRAEAQAAGSLQLLTVSPGIAADWVVDSKPPMAAGKSTLLEAVEAAEMRPEGTAVGRGFLRVAKQLAEKVGGKADVAALQLVARVVGRTMSQGASAGKAKVAGCKASIPQSDPELHHLGHTEARCMV